MELKRGLESELNEEDYYEILETKSIRLQNRVAPVIKALTFQAEPAATELLAAIDHFKHKDGAIDKHVPLDFLNPAERAAVLGVDQRFRVSLYKALLFRHVQSAIKSGTLNLEHSYKYRALDDYLIDRQRWAREKEQLLERAGMQDFADPESVLDALDDALDE